MSKQKVKVKVSGKKKKKGPIFPDSSGGSFPIEVVIKTKDKK